MKNNKHSVEILIFYGALFFTCVVGIIELLPEFDKWLYYDGWIEILFQIALSLLYFGLLTGTILSAHLFLRFYLQSYKLNKLPYPSVLVEQFFKGRMRWIFQILVSFIFISMYIAKAGLGAMTIAFVFLFCVVATMALKKTK